MLGSAYGLTAVGFTLLFGVLQAFNFAHGQVVMVGAFLSLGLVRLGIPFPLAVVGTGIGGGILSLVIERVCFRPFRKASALVPMLSTIGMAIFLQSVGTQIWESEPTPYKVGVEVVTYRVGPVLISSVQIIIVVLTLALVLGLGYMIQRTKMGRGMRAIAESPEKARSLGISANPVIFLAFAVSGAIASIAGILVGLNTTIISAFIGLDVGLKAFVAVALGGMGSVYGAMLAGLILGFVETFVTGYFVASYKDALVYGLMLVVLLVRPSGLLGRIESRRV